MPVDQETFEKVARSLRGLVAEGPVALRVLRPYTPFAIDFDINFRDEAVAAAVEEVGLSRGEYRQAIEDIEQVIAALVQGTALERGDDEQEDLAAVEEKKKCVQGLFDIQDLQKRAWIKETSKSDVLLDASWEVSLKQSDETKRPPNGEAIPVGLLALRGAALRNPFSILTGVDNTELLLTTDRSDLKALMETIRRLDEALAQLDVTEGSESSGSKP